MAPDMLTWIHHYAKALGVAVPSEAEVAALLALAGVAAHSSERPAAPLSCWLAAKAGVTPTKALAAAQDLAASLGTD